MRQGQLVYVMGASGSGKDSLLQALRPRLRGLPVACLLYTSDAADEL